MKAKINCFIFKFIKFLMWFFRVKFDKVTMELFKDFFKKDRLSDNLSIQKKTNGLSCYSSYTPDRYSLNFAIYKQQTNFLNYQDLKKWLAGNYENNIGDLSRFFFINLCIDYLLEENIIGNVAEVGVYKGNTAFLLAKYAQDVRINSTCYLFDTFEGFDQRDIYGHDSNLNENLFRDTSIEYVKHVLDNNNNVVYVKGYFPHSLTQVGEINSFSLVHIDCDLQKPITDSLNYFYPRLKKGGFLIMHDHSSLYWEGAKYAIDSFFKDKKESIIPIPDKSGSCVIRKV